MSTSFVDAILVNADLRGARLFNVDFHGADIGGAFLIKSGAFLDLEGAKITSPLQFATQIRTCPSRPTSELEQPLATVEQLMQLGERIPIGLTPATPPIYHDNVEPVVVLVDPGAAPPAEVGLLLSEISVLYMMLGGSGITFRVTDVHAPALATA